MTENGVRFFVHPCWNLKKMLSDRGCSPGRYKREETRAFTMETRASERSAEVRQNTLNARKGITTFLPGARSMMTSSVRIHLMLARALQPNYFGMTFWLAGVQRQNTLNARKGITTRTSPR